jgi:hypothetical protein
MPMIGRPIQSSSRCDALPRDNPRPGATAILPDWTGS